mgnify:CR=1 FL=1
MEIGEGATSQVGAVDDERSGSPMRTPARCGTWNLAVARLGGGWVELSATTDWQALVPRLPMRRQPDNRQHALTPMMAAVPRRQRLVGHPTRRSRTECRNCGRGDPNL